MLRLNSISLTQFKNYRQRSFQFTSRIVGISGPNGIGKTNLLDAMYYLCFTKGYFSRSDAMNINVSSRGFRIEGMFEIGTHRYDAVCILRETGKKEFLVNDELYEKFSAHVGRFPCVFIAPDDVRIITEGSEERRRYIDALLSQADAEYLTILMSYNRILQQRNSYLKAVSDNRMKDSGLLDVYDSQLVTDGNYIFTKRREFLSRCIDLVRDFYQKISGSGETVNLEYQSQLTKTSFDVLLQDSRERDLFLQRTTTGIHKDDMLILLHDQNFKLIASQGQRKSMLFALKLAEFTILREIKGFAPLLLLDDVFEKLDAARMHNLLDWVCAKNEGQIMITDTHAARITEHLEKLNVPFQLIEL